MGTDKLRLTAPAGATTMLVGAIVLREPSSTTLTPQSVSMVEVGSASQIATLDVTGGYCTEVPFAEIDVQLVEQLGRDDACELAFFVAPAPLQNTVSHVWLYASCSLLMCRAAIWAKKSVQRLRRRDAIRICCLTPHGSSAISCKSIALALKMLSQDRV